MAADATVPRPEGRSTVTISEERSGYAFTAPDRAAVPVPRLFAARTVQVYVLPAVRPFTVIGLALPTTDLDPHVTAKPVIAAPLLAPALNDTLIAVFPALAAFKCDTAAGVPIVTDTPAEAGPAPEPVTAATVNVTLEPNANGPFISVVVPGPSCSTAEPVLGVTR